MFDQIRYLKSAIRWTLFQRFEGLRILEEIEAVSSKIDEHFTSRDVASSTSPTIQSALQQYTAYKAWFDGKERTHNLFKTASSSLQNKAQTPAEEPVAGPEPSN